NKPFDTEKNIRHIKETFDSYLALLPPPTEMMDKNDRASLRAASDIILKALASRLHMHLHYYFQEGLLKTTAYHGDMTQDIWATNVAYHLLLERSQNAAKESNISALHHLARNMLFRLLETMPDLLIKAASTSRNDLKKGQYYGLQISDLSRRMVMAMTGCLSLALDLQDTYKTRHTKEAANKIKLLARKDMRLRRAHIMARRSAKEGTAIKGKLDHIKFYNRPGKPFTTANFVSTDTILLAPFKSLLRMGVTNGASFWGIGKMVKTSSTPLFEIEFEGAGQHAKTYWEDYLSYSLRDIYNLYPGALRMTWEFPDIRRSDAMSDLIGRIK
ncbi:MAG: hypothetical protein CO093_05060, partial [Alphaproteobacteria bacterium CG_4_9_14_3_um_filter_47_13]